MSKTLVIAFAVGIAVIAIAVGGIFYAQRGAHMSLPGKILKVRTAPLADNSSVAVVDYRVTNPSDYTFMAKGVTLVLEDAGGNRIEGQTASELDAQRLFAGVPLLGQKYNESLKERDKVAPHSTADRMVAARFEVPEEALQKRKQFIVRVEEVDGMISEFGEKK